MGAHSYRSLEMCWPQISSLLHIHFWHWMLYQGQRLATILESALFYGMCTLRSVLWRFVNCFLLAGPTNFLGHPLPIWDFLLEAFKYPQIFTVVSVANLWAMHLEHCCCSVTCTHLELVEFPELDLENCIQHLPLFLHSCKGLPTCSWVHINGNIMHLLIYPTQLYSPAPSFKKFR